MASGRIEVATSGLTGSTIDMWIEWESVPDYVNNYSTVTVNLKYQRKILAMPISYSGINLSQAVVICDLNTNSRYHSQINGGIVTTALERPIKTASTETFIIPHNANGELSLEIYVQCTFDKDNFIVDHTATVCILEKIDTAFPNIKSLTLIPGTNNVLLEYAIESNGNSLDLKQYSFDGGSTWNNLPADNIIPNLIDYTDYSLLFRVRKAINQKTTVSTLRKFKTLAIKLISFDFPSSLDIDEGSFIEYDINFRPQNASVKTLNFEYSTPGIVTADYEKISGKLKGNSVITVSTGTPNDRIIKTCNVNVYRRVTGLTLTDYSLRINPSVGYQIVWTVSPYGASNQAVTFTSSDESVATVDNNGWIGAIAEGECTITVKTEDKGFEAVITVVVDNRLLWQELNTSPERLNYTDFYKIYSNQAYLRECMIEQGEMIEFLKAVNPQLNTPYCDMFSIFSNIEANMDILNSGSFVSPNYIEPHTIGEYEPNRQDYNRLVMILYDLKQLLETQSANV